MTKPLAALAFALPLALSAAASGWAATGAPAAATAQPAERTAYILFGSGNDSNVMNGSDGDLARARAARRGQEALLYLRQGGRGYVVRDAATLARANAIFAPQREMGDRQAALGEQQAALGERQAALGAEQARLGLRQASAGTGAAAADLGSRQDALGRRQDALGRQQDALGRQQAALGREQERLGRIAAAQLRTLAADAVRTGLAQRAD